MIDLSGMTILGYTYVYYVYKYNFTKPGIFA